MSNLSNGENEESEKDLLA